MIALMRATQSDNTVNHGKSNLKANLKEDQKCVKVNLLHYRLGLKTICVRFQFGDFVLAGTTSISPKKSSFYT